MCVIFHSEKKFLKGRGKGTWKVSKLLKFLELSKNYLELYNYSEFSVHKSFLYSILSFSFVRLLENSLQ